MVSRERWTVNRDGQDLGDAVREDGGRGKGGHMSAQLKDACREESLGAQLNLSLRRPF